jgi:TaqI-like C-terminal specificity domain
LVARDRCSAKLLVPFLRGENIKRWRIESDGLWLLNIEFGWTRKRFADISATDEDDKEAEYWRALGQAYPAVADHLAPFEQKARVRTDQGQYWWELRACTYSNQFRRPKIIYPDMSQGPKFAYDESNAFSGNTTYFVASNDVGLVTLLNSRVAWLHIFGEGGALRGGKWRVRMFTEDVTTIPVPEAPTSEWGELTAIGKEILRASKDWAHTNQLVLKRIPDLCPKERKPKLTERLKEWWKLDFKSFQAEIKKAFKGDIPLKQRNEWESFLREEGAKVRRLMAEIEQAEREIDAIVYKLFDLTPDEIALLESSLSGQY